jgi:hypothetical protein
MKTVLALTAFAMLSCASSKASIPDPTIPHRVAREGKLEVWVRQPDGSFSRTKVRVLEGWWIAGPPVVEPGPAK